MREREANERRANMNFKTTVLRIRFPDRIEIEGSFRASETTNSVIDFVKLQLADSSKSFYLYTTPPHQRLQDDTTLADQQLVPKAIVHVSFSDQNEIESSKVLKETLLDKIEERVVELKTEELGKHNSETSKASSSVKETSKPAASQPVASNKPGTKAAPSWFTKGKK